MNGMARVLALDVGIKRIGMAMSDPLGITAQGLPTLQRTKPEEDLKKLADLVREHAVATVVVGLPLQLDGNEGPAVVHIRAFIQTLAAALGPGVAIAEFDERMTTAQARRDLRPLGRASDQRRSGQLDRAAAQILLMNYLGATRSRPPE